MHHTTCPAGCSVSKDAWERVRLTLRSAVAAHYDGCHDIYLSLDDTQAAHLQALGYLTQPGDLEQVRAWFDASCALRSISTARTTTDDDGQVAVDHRDLIAMFELETEACE